MPDAPKQTSLPLGDASSTTAAPHAGGGERDERVEGVIDRVTFRSEETGFSVLRIRVPGRRELVTVVGRAAHVIAGQSIEATGSWVEDSRYGTQLRAESLYVREPVTTKGIERYLSSGLVRGIGPELAKRLVAAFGDAVFDVIENEPERLREVPGVGQLRAERMIGAWSQQRRVRDIMVFLHDHGLGTARAVRVYRTYGDAAIAEIRAKPYDLAMRVTGIGFGTADALAVSLGTPRESPERVAAGLRHLLAEARGQGHCGLPVDDLVARAEKLLDVPKASVDGALATGVAAGEWVRDRSADRACVFESGLYDLERAAAARLREAAAGPPPWDDIDPETALPWVESRLEIELAPSQREALARALRERLLVLTGGPGVGKTTLLRALLEILDTKDVRALLAAPTGRAAKRMAEATGRVAKTLHRLLEFDPRHGGFRRNANRSLDGDLVIVDESSMLDVPLLGALLDALPEHAGLLLIGDADQLPSVGPGQVLADAIDAGTLPVVRLSEIFRQAKESRIVRNAHLVNRGELPELETAPDGDFFFVDADDSDTAAAKLVTVVRERIPARFGLDPVRDVQVLCPMRRGRLGANALNTELQAALNPSSPAADRVERFGNIFAPGDKVMQIVNDYERNVFNGDVGFVSEIDPVEGELAALFEGRRVSYPFDELDSLTLAYATTVHKAQGSEVPAVVVPVTTQHFVMLQRNLIYTAITRAQKLVVLVGQRRALAMAVRSNPRTRRITKLADHLRP